MAVTDSGLGTGSASFLIGKTSLCRNCPKVGYDPESGKEMEDNGQETEFHQGAAGLAAGLLAGSCLSDSSDTSIQQPGSGPSGGDNP